MLTGTGDCFRTVPGFGDHGHAGGRLHEDAEAASYQGLVVGDENPDRHW
jgi:hypothetical protein